MEKLMQARALNKFSCWVCLVPPWGFADRMEEELYAAYTQRQRQRAAPRLLAAGVLLQAFAALVPGERDLAFAYGCFALALAVNLALAVAYACVRPARLVLNHLTWLVLWAQLLVSASRRLGDSYNELLGWAVVLQYFTLAALPFHYLVLMLYSTISFSGYLLIQYYNAVISESRLPDDFCPQQIANGLLLLGATLLGGTAYGVGEWQQRCSFKVTKRSLRDKLTIEQQSKEQERLLLSVLPEHVAVQMRKDLGLIDTQFKKIYMSRHENVSILYADIVGFTAISSTYSAQDLVAILNELFARFDRLAEKYQQLRIKILGDCYYCISGAPVERPDHAVLCVHMGLSMVKAIKYVQQTTNSPVDMRVGIHTGAVLAGVLGQHQWQFDVYSRDVELANKMESSGMAGRVHISEKTLSYLNDEFEVEPAHGERREEMLRQAGIKTYFIVRVLKPFGGEDRSVPEGETAEGGDSADTLSDLKDDDEDSVLSPQEESKGNEDMKILAMLKEELVNRDDDKELADATTACLTFKAAEVERAYARRADPCPMGVAAPALMLLPPVVALASFAVPPSWPLHAVYLAFVLETGLINVAYYAYFRYAQYKEKPVSPYWKLVCGTFNIAMFVATNIAPLVICGNYEAALDDGLRPDAISHGGARRCIHPSYYYHVGAGALCGALWVSPLSGGARGALLASLAAAHAAPAALTPALLAPRPSLDRDPYAASFNASLHYSEPAYNLLAQIHIGRHIIMLFFIVIALLILNRYTESLERARHSRGERMRVQADQAKDLRRRNQALVHNVLPPHVARHFMGARHNHRDLYSQSYAEVGVLFASMPNFSEFYSEETVNNQGLECLRFLNEVISDFDLLLEDAKFSKDIIKIKTISSTYMAASGLNPTREMQVLCALTFFATGSDQRVVGVSQHLTQRTTSRCIRQVVQALNHPSVVGKWIVFPQTQEARSNSRQKFQRNFNLPGVIGCIDCTHIALVRPGVDEHLFFNRKGYHSLNVQMPSDGTLVRWAHLACLVEFALELQRVLAAINEQSFNHFVLRMGVNHGPITAGVIGARKPHYDIWGNTVNVASRMESTGKAGCIQVTEETCHILETFGYYFEQRGLVAVKGKGQLMTYYLLGKRDANTVMALGGEASCAGAGDSSLVNGSAAAQTLADPEAGVPLLPR